MKNQNAKLIALWTLFVAIAAVLLFDWTEMNIAARIFCIIAAGAVAHGLTTVYKSLPVNSRMEEWVEKIKKHIT